MSTLEAPADDSLSQTLAKFKPEDLLNVISGLKKVADQDPQQARSMLEANQDLAYSVLQAELLMGLIGESVISEQIEEFKAKALAQSASEPAPTPTPEPTQVASSAPVAESTSSASAPEAPASPVASDPFAALDPQQAAIIKQVISLPEEQLVLLPAEQQEQVRNLKLQYQTK